MDRKSFIRSSSMLGMLPFLSGIGYNFNVNDQGKPKLKGPQLDSSYWYMGHLLSLLISSSDTNGAFSLIHGYEIQGLEPPPHSHTKEDESFYLLSGEIDYYVDGKMLSAKGGDIMFLPRNVQHHFKVKSETAEVLILLTPGGFENYFIEMAEPAQELVIPPRPQGPPNIEKLIATASKYGIIFPKPN